MGILPNELSWSNIVKRNQTFLKVNLISALKGQGATINLLSLVNHILSGTSLSEVFIHSYFIYIANLWFAK